MNHLFEEFLELIGTSDFLNYYRNLCEEVIKSLNFGFINNQKEPDILKSLVKSICKTKKINNSEIKTYGIFIHGQKSQVEFDYLGQNTQKELGDLLFLLTVVNKQKILFEKFTISQFKKSSNTKTIRSWKIDKEQLYLLSRFPEFNGVSGIVKGKKLKLNNFLGYLGSYNLLYSPGDFVYVTAPVLEDLLGGKSSIKRSDFALLNTYHNNCIPFCCFKHYPELRYCLEECFDRWVSSECRYFFKHLLICLDKCLPHFRHKRCLFDYSPIWFSSIYSNNIYNFLFNYLTGRIGELINCDCFCINKTAKSFIKNLFQYIYIKANQPQDNVMKFLGISRTEDLKNIKEYIQLKDFENYGDGGGGGEVNREGDFQDGKGGFGIIHTVINMGQD